MGTQTLGAPGFGASGLDATGWGPAGAVPADIDAALGAAPFGPAFAAELDRLFDWRRDVRRFRTDPVEPGLVRLLIARAASAPSVGLSEPWRFVRVESAAARAAARANFAAANARALAGYDGARAGLYAGLKLAGMDAAPVQIAVYCAEDDAKGHGLGAATMPETRAYSVVCAVMQLWLAARARGLGLGWVSILDPAALARALEVPPAWRLIAYLCLGWPEEEHDDPDLARAGWEQRKGAADRVLVR